MTMEEPVYFLLVDDLEENLLSLEALLKRPEVVMLKARSGQEALELLLQYEVALALLDVQMPGMDGFELAEFMRGNERTGRVPIIFLTAGSADRQRRFRGYEAGAVDFLHKPIEPDILRSKAEVFFELFRQRRQLAVQRDEVKAYADALKEADQRKDEFLAMLAHELRNPLAPVRYALEIMRMAPDRPVPEDLRSMLERQVVHLVRLIDDLLDISRVSRGKIDLRKESIDLDTALQAAIEASQPLIEAQQHTLTVEKPVEPVWLEADLTRLAQVLSNLLNNAAKYTPDGGQIGLTVTKMEDKVMISVSDNGSGIPPEMLPRIFELFTQLDHGHARAQGGLGIGLALSRQLVEMHGGTVTVQSEGVGRGSVFTVELPVLEKKVQEESLPQPDEEEMRALQVLVVDDNVSSADTTGQILKMLGHQVTVVHNGREAVDVAREQHPEVIMLDIGMPGMNGYDVCRELRQDPAFQQTLFVAQTGWGQERDRERTREAGFDHHLTKPIDFKELTALLAKV